MNEMNIFEKIVKETLSFNSLIRNSTHSKRSQALFAFLQKRDNVLFDKSHLDNSLSKEEQAALRQKRKKNLESCQNEKEQVIEKIKNIMIYGWNWEEIRDNKITEIKELLGKEICSRFEDIESHNRRILIEGVNCVQIELIACYIFWKNLNAQNLCDSGFLAINLSDTRIETEERLTKGFDENLSYEKEKCELSPQTFQDNLLYWIGKGDYGALQYVKHGGTVFLENLDYKKETAFESIAVKMGEINLDSSGNPGWIIVGTKDRNKLHGDIRNLFTTITLDSEKASNEDSLKSGTETKTKYNWSIQESNKVYSSEKLVATLTETPLKLFIELHKKVDAFVKTTKLEKKLLCGKSTNNDKYLSDTISALRGTLKKGFNDSGVFPIDQIIISRTTKNNDAFKLLS